MTTILVTGGRNYSDSAELFDRLHQVHCEHVVTCVIHGNASGADTLAQKWADDNGIPTIPVPADWKRYGRAAGPIRNRAMLDMKPDLVVAFAGGKGTANMVKQARNAGIRVIE